MRGKVWGGEAIVGIVGFEPAECIVICVGGIVGLVGTSVIVEGR